MAAEGSRAALRDRPQDPRLLVREGVSRTKRRAVLPHDVSYLKGRRWTEWSPRSGAVGGDDSRGMGYPAGSEVR